MRRLDQILQDVADRQIHLYLEDGKLKFKAPKNALDSTLAGEIKQYKPQIIQMLSRSSEAAHPVDVQDKKPPTTLTLQVYKFFHGRGPFSVFFL